MPRVARTVAVRSERLSKRTFRVLAELEGMYRDMVERLVSYAVENEVRSFIRLKAIKYHELRDLYPRLPSHYAYAACQDAAARAKSFLRLRRNGRAERPEVRKVTVWLDDHP